MSRFLLLFTLVLLASGCGALLDFDPADPQDAGASDFGAGLDAHVADDGGTPDASRPDAGPPPACRIDAQCDDHVFCNGTEHCLAGNCVAGAPVACPGGVRDCVVGFCDGALDACATRADDRLCAAGEVCDRMGGCVPRPSCALDTDCAHDACHHATCSAGSCVLALDPPCVDPTPGDCLITFCHPVLGCTESPSTTMCDDGILCTTDVCRTDGSCGNFPNDTFCDFDGLTCTHDTCVPGNACGDPTTGCLSTPDDSFCGSWLGTLGLVDPPPACFRALCLPSASVDPVTGCALTPVCNTPGTVCVATGATPPDAGMSSICGISVSVGCATGTSCDDGDPCNGTETCSGPACRAGTPPCGTTGALCILGHSGAVSCVPPPATACVSGT